MTCGYCGCRNADGEYRCRRCGRKPGDRLGGDAVYTEGALAAVAQAATLTESAKAAPAARPANLARAVQRPLFLEKPESNVLSFDAYASGLTHLILDVSSYFAP